MKLSGPPPKLTPEQVAALRQWAALGRSAADIARRWGVSPTTIRTYLSGQRKWAA